MFASYSALALTPPTTGYGPIVSDLIDDHIEPSDVVDDDEMELRQYELGRTQEPGLVKVVMRTSADRPALTPQPPPSPSPSSPMVISPKMNPSRSRLTSPTARKSPIANKPGTKSSTLMAISPKQNSIAKKTPTKSNRSPTSSTQMQSNRQVLARVNPNNNTPTKPRQISNGKSINVPLLGGSFYPMSLFNNVLQQPSQKPKSMGGFMTADELEAEEQAARQLQKQLRDVHEIAPKLFLSGRFPAQSKSILDSFGITHILVAAGNEIPKFQQDFFYFKLDVVDRLEENLLPHFDKCADYVNSSLLGGGTVLVHCSAGVSRSASIVAAYLIKYCKMSSENAVELLKSKRSIVNPNTSFLTQLQQFHKLKQKERGELSLLDEVLSGLMSVF